MEFLEILTSQVFAATIKSKISKFHFFSKVIVYFSELLVEAAQLVILEFFFWVLEIWIVFALFMNLGPLASNTRT